MASAIIFINARIVVVMKWCRLSDSNGRPTDYKSVALPAELKRQRLPFTITIPQRSSPLCMLFRPSVRRATNNADRGHVFAYMRPSTARRWRDSQWPGADGEGRGPFWPGGTPASGHGESWGAPWAVFAPGRQ